MPRTPLNEGPEPSRSVGYGQPPVHHKIQDGEIRNPYGRRGKPKPKIDFMDEMVTVTASGERRRVTRSEAIDYFLFAQASKGNVKASDRLEDRARQRQQGAADQTELSAAEQAAFERFIRRKAERLAGGERS